MGLTIPFSSAVSTTGAPGIVTAVTIGSGGFVPVIYMVQFDLTNLPLGDTLELIVLVDNAEATLESIFDETFAGPSTSPFIIDVGARLASDGALSVGFDQLAGTDVFDVPIVVGELTT